MQTIKNKTFPIINSIRLLIQVGVILAIVTTSFLVQKQPVHAATNSNIKTNVLARPGSFKKTSPTKAATKQPINPTLSWGTSSGATSYQYCINTNASCKAPAAWISTGNSTQVTLSGLTQGNKYYWQVQSSNTSGKTYANGSKSAWWSLTIATTLTPTSTSVAPTPTPTATSVAPTPTPTATNVPPTPTTTVTPVPTQGQSGNTYYVATSGDDANTGTFEQPFKTIQKGVNKLVAGDTLYVRGGTYNEKVKVDRSGSSFSPIIISSYPGENAIIDGSGLSPNVWPNQLVTLEGNYIVLENFELSYPLGSTILIDRNSSYDTIKNLNVHNVLNNGIIVYGNNTTIENNKFWQTMLKNNPPGRPGVIWGGTIAIGDSSNGYFGLNTIVRNNDVYQNYGEGILCIYTDNTLIEGNHVWDNWAEDIYLDQCSFITIKNNLMYYTNDLGFWRNENSPANGILISNEDLVKNPTHPVGHDRTIFNNIIVNTGSGIGFWTGYASGSALVNDIIANNTIVSNNTYSRGFNIGTPKDTNHQNTIIENNLVLVNNEDSIYIPSNNGITFSNNLWSREPDAYASVVGAGDIIADPLLINSNQTIDLNQIAHPINVDWYLPSSLSPAVDKARALSYVTNDFLGTLRRNNPDIGALEYQK